MKKYLALKKIVESGSLSKAADAMGYSQSAMSQIIKTLEDEIGITLLNRNRLGAALTPEGASLYPYIENMINQYHGVLEKAKEIKGLDTGIIRMGMLASISAHWLPGLIKEFKEQYPRVDFVIHQGDYTSIPEWIRTDDVDFGIVTPQAASGLQTLVLKEGAMSVILPAAHPLASRAVIPLKELKDEPFILLEEGSYYEPLEAFKSVGITPNIKFRIHDDYAIMTMVEAGLGISILADLVLLRTNYNIVKRPTDPAVSRTIAIGYKNEKSLPIASKRFIQHIQNQLDRLP